MYTFLVSPGTAMIALVAIAVWLALFTGFLWVMDRVNREFWYTGNCRILMSMTFYTAGVAGVFLLLGRQNRSPLIAGWVRDIIESPPVESIGRRIPGIRTMQRVLETGTGAQQNGSEKPAPEQSSDILDFVLKKAVTKQASSVHFENFPSELRITYIIGNTMESDKVLAKELRRRVISALTSKINRASPADGKKEKRQPLLTLNVAGRNVRFKASMVKSEQGTRFVLSRLKTGS